MTVSDTAKLYGYFIKTVIVEGILLHQSYVFNTHIQTDIAVTDETWLWFNWPNSVLRNQLNRRLSSGDA